MKRNRIISIIIALSLMVCSSVPVYASELSTASSPLPSEAISKISIGTSLLDVNTPLILGNEIPSYYWDGENFDPISDIRYLPIYSNNDIVGIASIIDPDSSNPSYSVGKQFASELNAAVELHGGSYCLVFNGSQTFYYGNGEAVLLSESKPGLLPFETNNITSATRTDEPPVSTVSSPSIISSRKIYYDFSESDLEADMTNAQKSLSFASAASSKTNIILQSPSTRTTYEDFELLPIGHIDQGSTMLCWAVCTVLTGEYRTNISDYDIYDIADGLGIDYDEGGNNVDIIDALYDFYRITGTSQQGYYSYNNVKYWIDRDKPIIALAYSGGNGLGHAVTICGYYFDHNSIIWSESYGTHAGSYCYVTADSSGQFVFVTNGVRYTWTYSVTV